MKFNAVVAVVVVWAIGVACNAQAQTATPYQQQLPPTSAGIGLEDLVQIGLQNNPALFQAGFNVDAARGRELQAGLYPNPTLEAAFDEVFDRTGPGGINTFPFISQEIVTAHKLKLQKGIARRDFDSAMLELTNQRYVLLATIRKGFYRVLAAQRRVEVLGQLRDLAQQSFRNAEQLQKAGRLAELDVLGFRIEYNRLVARLEAAQRELAATWRELAASIGAPHLPVQGVLGSLEAPLPQYDYTSARERLVQLHPQLRSADVQLTKAEVTLRRAEVEKIPNITIGAGYTRQNQNASDDVSFLVSVPLPLFNRNQGNVLAAQADIGRAQHEIRRVEYALLQNLATSFGKYAAGVERLQRYRGGILDDAIRAYKLSLAAFQGGQFEYLRVLQAQKQIAEANLEYIDALEQAWEGASEISGLLLEEHWPATAAAANEQAK